MIETLTVGPLATNCYIVRGDGAREGLVIDPGDEAERILETTRRLEVTLTLIVNTHAHFDHAGADSAVAAATGAKIAVHALDVPVLLGESSGADWLGGGRLAKAETLLAVEDGHTLAAGGLELEVLHTPGHTEGSICLLGQGVIFTGDLLFQGSVGRTDLPGGSYGELIGSLKRIAVLGGDLKVYPGHGPSTTLARERRTNPYLDRAVTG